MVEDGDTTRNVLGKIIATFLASYTVYQKQQSADDKSGSFRPIQVVSKRQCDASNSNRWFGIGTMRSASAMETSIGDTVLSLRLFLARACFVAP